MYFVAFLRAGRIKLGLALLPLAFVVVWWALADIALAQEPFLALAKESAPQHGTCYEASHQPTSNDSRVISVIDEHDRTISVGDIFSDRSFVWQGRSDFHSFDRQMPVCIIVQNSTNVVLNVEDIFGDNVFAWAGGDVDLSNLFGGSGAQQAASRPDDDERFTFNRPAEVPPGNGVDFRLRMPVEILIENSAGVTVDIEDIFGDNVITWAQGDAQVSNLAGSSGSRVPGPPGLLDAVFELQMPVAIRVASSRDVTVDAEDFIGDIALAQTGSDARVSNLSGSPDGTGTPERSGSLRVRAPVELDIRHSSNVLIDIEDIFGDNVLARAGGDVELSNLEGQVPSAARTPLRLLDLPFRINVQDSQRVEVDTEDIFGDVVIGSAGGAAFISNLRQGAAPGDSANQPRSRINVPLDLHVRDSQAVTLGIEDIFGDVEIVGTGEDLCVSNLEHATKGNATPGVVRLQTDVPVTIRVWNSLDVSIDVEDVFGDNVSVLDSGNYLRSLLVDVPVDLFIFGSTGVDIQIAEVLSNNQFALTGTAQAPWSPDAAWKPFHPHPPLVFSAATEPPLLLEGPGRYELPGGVLVIRSHVKRRVVRSSSVQLTVERFFVNNTAGGIDPARINVPGGQQLCSEVHPSTPPTYLGAQPGQPAAFRIVIDPGPRLAANPEALAAIERAARRWEAVLDDPIEVTIAFGFSEWTPPGLIAQARTPQFEVDYHVAREALVADASDELAQSGGFGDALTTALPRQFEASVPPHVTLTGQVALTAANAKALGFKDPNGDLADAAINLNAHALYDYDLSDGLARGHLDLESVALHEIGHVLGFASAVDAVNQGKSHISPMPLDLYRFDADTLGPTATVETFTLSPRTLYPGREANLWFMDQIFPMATGEQTGYFSDVDGHQARHWRVTAGQSLPMGAMTPRLDLGQRLSVSCADLRALDLIGYEVADCSD